MSRTFGSPRHKALVAFIKKKRKDAGLTQTEVAERIDRYQSFVATFERGQKRIDAVELIEIAEAIGFDPREALKAMMKAKS
jgi:transcriptional regulator with XRE-family HTH domain